MPKRKKTQLETKLDEAQESGQYMVAVWHNKDGQLHLYRLTQTFPTALFPEAVRLLEKDLAKG